MAHRPKSQKPSTPLSQQATPGPDALASTFHNIKSQLYRDPYASGQNLRQVTWNNSGTRLACIPYSERNIRVWTVDKPDAQKSAYLKSSATVHSKPIECLCWDPANSDALIALAGDGTIREWDTKSRTSKDHKKVQEPAYILKISSDGTRVAVVCGRNSVVVMDRSLDQETALRYEFPGTDNDQDIYELAWSNNSDYLAIGLGKGTVQILAIDESAKKIELLQELKGHRTATTCLEFDLRGKYLASGSNEGIVSIWDLSNWICVKTFTKTNFGITSIGFSHDSALIAVATESSNSPIEIVKVSDGEYLHTIKRNNACSRPCLEWHPLRYSLAATGDPYGMTVYGSTLFRQNFN